MSGSANVAGRKRNKDNENRRLKRLISERFGMDGDDEIFEAR